MEAELDDDADISAPRHTRIGIAIVVVALHVLAGLALVQAFAPDFTTKMVNQVVATFNVTITAPEPPKPEPTGLTKAGTAAPVGKKATPREVAAPKPRHTIAPVTAPPVAAKGPDNTSGASVNGQGTGAGGTGQGTGSGGGGDGTGSGGATKLALIAGDINSAKDYPVSTRSQRLGDSVIVALTVGPDGRVRNCRVHKASRDAEADQITCRLATERFRFRPRTNNAGQPVEGLFHWQQRWFTPGRGN